MIAAVSERGAPLLPGGVVAVHPGVDDVDREAHVLGERVGARPDGAHRAGAAGVQGGEAREPADRDGDPGLVGGDVLGDPVGAGGHQTPFARLPELEVAAVLQAEDEGALRVAPHHADAQHP
ncbi:hypothetical protein GCM10010317_078890 [Streptomyces mirabilis]|nr:hypothetical protein GCM10010317_078890 [Streptomyces mirabilis]